MGNKYLLCAYLLKKSIIISAVDAYQINDDLHGEGGHHLEECS